MSGATSITATNTKILPDISREHSKSSKRRRASPEAIALLMASQGTKGTQAWVPSGISKPSRAQREGKGARENEMDKDVFLDGTFFADGEVNRPMSEIPHPFVTETIELLSNAPLSIRQRVYFTHFNHTNPLVNPSNPMRARVEKLGFHLAKEGTFFSL